MSPLAQSLTEFADMLEDDGGQEKWEGLGGKGEWSELGGKGKGELEGLGAGMYNPFDPQGKLSHDCHMTALVSLVLSHDLSGIT